MAHVTINHIAVVVESVDAALPFWRDALGLSAGGVQDVPAEQVKIAFLEAGDSHIELVQPVSDDSGIAKYLAKKGAGMHHICFEVDDLEAALAHMREKGIELINDTPKERDGRRYAFIHPKGTGGVLVELYERLPGE
jgi:methylmalonyl-CoA/ethylmalonyl-CoA epimerase